MAFGLIHRPILVDGQYYNGQDIRGIVHVYRFFWLWFFILIFVYEDSVSVQGLRFHSRNVELPRTAFQCKAKLLNYEIIPGYTKNCGLVMDVLYRKVSFSHSPLNYLNYF